MTTAGYKPLKNYSTISEDDDDAIDIGATSNSANATSKSGIQVLHNQVQEVVGVMKDNIDKILDRDVALNNLAARADDLQTSATSYNRTAKQLRHKYWWQNMKTNVCITVIILAVVMIVIASIVLSRRGKN